MEAYSYKSPSQDGPGPGGDKDTPRAKYPRVAFTPEQVESLCGGTCEAGETLEVKLVAVRQEDNGDTLFEVERTTPEMEDEAADEALGYPRSKMVKKLPAPKLSAADLMS